ncbi:MAG: hypothetical protein K9J13_01860 [Saprospiraceae bacterium]|nr:hypothetical protein [Saprospiraceae bacterium]
MKIITLLIGIILSFNLAAQPNDMIHSFELDSYGVKVYNSADKMPEMSLSNTDFMRLLSSKLEWPEVDTNCWFDKVYFEIIVYADSSIKTNSLRIVGPMCIDDKRIDEMKKELRNNLDKIFYNIPKWIPGEVNSQKVAVKYIIPIHVHLSF